MIICPNKNLPEWKTLASSIGNDRAMLAFIRNNNTIPTPEVAKELLSNKKLLKSYIELSTVNNEFLINQLKTQNTISDFTVNKLGRTWYALTPKDNRESISQLTEYYGPVIITDGNFITINEEAVDLWNGVINSISKEELSLQEINKRFLTNMGISLNIIEDLTKKYGVNGIADMLEKTISIQKGQEQALTEEALHFYIEMLPQDMPELVDALDKIRTTDTYKNIVGTYSKNKEYKLPGGGINYSKIQKEALAKEISNHLTNNTRPQSWLLKILNTIKEWISGVRLARDSKDIIAEMYMSGDIANLNRNLSSSEIYYQLSSDEKKFYESQNMNSNQKAVVDKLIGVTSQIERNDLTHTYEHISYLSPDTPAVKTVLPSVTKKLGSDFYNELETPESIELIIDSFDLLYETAYDVNDSNQVKSKKILDKVIEDILQGTLSKEDLDALFGDENSKIATALFKAGEARRKTIFGTAIHDIAKAVVYNQDVKDVKVDSAIIDEQTLHTLIYGDINTKGILDILKDLKKDGKVLMTEIQVFNKGLTLAGEFDLITIDQNGVVDVYDFKTKYLPVYKSNKKSLEDEFMEVSNLSSSIGVKDEDGVFPELKNIKRTSFQKWGQQVSLYKKILMEYGIPVNTINIIGIPYRLDENNKIKAIKAFEVPKLAFNKRIGSSLFPNLNEDLDIASKKVEETPDPRLTAVIKIPKITLKKSFVKALERLSELQTKFKDTDSGKSLYSLLDESADSNTLARIKSLTQNTLDNLPSDDLENMPQFITVQKNFLEMLEGSSVIIDKVVREFERLANTIPQDQVASSQRLSELGKIHNFLIGYQKMFDEINKSLGVLDPNNPIVIEISNMMGAVKQVQSLYIETILPDIKQGLSSEFTKELVNNTKREYYELIQAAKQRGDTKAVASLTKELEMLPDDSVIIETLKGNNGDVGTFFGKYLAIVSNPDLILAGIGKKLQAVLNKVRIQNKDLRDRLSTELEKRVKVFGRDLNLNRFNKDLVYISTTVDPKTGKERDELVIKSEFDESLYNNLNKLKYAIVEAQGLGDEESIIKAKKDLRAFEVEFLQTNRTDEYYKLHKILDTVVTHNGVKTTINDLRLAITSEIGSIQRNYHEEDNMTDEDIEKIDLLWDKYYQLTNKKYLDGTDKEGDDLLIAETLLKWREISSEIYEDVEIKGMFDKRNNKMKLEYGEDSPTYKSWFAKNTREVITPEYYEYVNSIYERLAELKGSTYALQIKEKYNEISLLTSSAKDKDRTINGSRIREENLERIIVLNKEIEDLKELERNNEVDASGFTRAEKEELFEQLTAKRNFLATYNPARLSTLYEIRKTRQANDPLLAEKAEQINELYKELSSIQNTSTTKYYDERLEQEEKLFAEAHDMSYEQFKNDPIKYREFQQSKWFQDNHITSYRKSYDPEAGDYLKSSSYTPISIWKRTTPNTGEFVTIKPSRAYYKHKLKESYEKDGKTIFLIRKDNKDVQQRLKPKTAEEYKNEYGKEHPYLNEDYKKLKEGYQNSTLSVKDKVTYENLLYLRKELLEAQEGIEVTSRLGMSVPFMEKTDLDRTIETGGQNIKTGLESAIAGLKRKFTRTEVDADNGLLPVNEDYSKMATVDNNEMKFVPVRFTSKGDLSNASYDVWGGVLNYVGSINRKKALDKEVPFLEGVEAILADENNQPKGDKKNLLINNITKKYIPDSILKINKGGNVRLEVLKSFINSTLYNEEFFKGTDIMGINTQKTISQAMNVASFAALGVAPFNWGVNFLSGQVQNMIELVAGRNITTKDYLSSKKEIYSGVGKFPPIIKDMVTDFTKVGNRSFWGQMMEIYDPIQGEMEKTFANGTRFHKVKNILSLGIYAGKVWGEWEIQVSTWLAYMKNHKLYENKFYNRESFITMRLGDISGMNIKQIREKKLEILKEFDKLTTNLLDVHELNSDKKLVISDKYKDVFELGSKEFSDVVSGLHAMQKRINGSYAKQDKTFIEKTSLGRMMFFFRKYVIPLGMNRWGDRRVDYEGMQIEEGFYRTFLRTIGKDLLMMRWGNLTGKNYSDRELAGIKKTMADVAVIVSCVAILTFLLGYDTDDDDNMDRLKDRPWAYQALIFLLLKTKSETEQFIPTPSTGLSELTRLATNPSMLFTNASQYIKILNLAALQALNTVPGLDFDKDLYYQSDADIGDGPLFLKDKGDSKLFAKLMKSFVGYDGKTFSPADKIKDFQFTQR